MAQLSRKPRAFLPELSPAYFSMVMATGIVSISAQRLGWSVLALVLFGINIIVYVLLWALYCVRLVRYRHRVIADLYDHSEGMGFFTIIAATGILGSQFLLLIDCLRIAAVLLLLAIVLWLLLTYSIFTVFTIKDKKPTLDMGINGGWLLAVVATQAVAVLSGMLAAHADHDLAYELNFFTISLWLWGGMLYIWMMTLIFYRYMFFALQPCDLSPSYWINMGAMAISTLAGAQLSINAAQTPFLHSLLPFIKGFTIFYWVTGTWWIPMLVVLGFWRHVYKRFPLRYDPLYWALVFPIGMYATGTFEMAKVLKVAFLQPLVNLMFVTALIAWTSLFVGQLRALWRYWRDLSPH